MTVIPDTRDWVGPVLQKGPVADAVVAAIRDLNDEVIVVDRGAYLRVLSPRRCRVTSVAVAGHAGAPFRLPSDLEIVMSSFKGFFEVSEDEATWKLGEGGPQ
jgi:toluene monooxygenase system protein D